MIYPLSGIALRAALAQLKDVPGTYIRGQFGVPAKYQVPMNCRSLVGLPDTRGSGSFEVSDLPPEFVRKPKLYPWQPEAVNFALPRDGAYLFHSGGAGKTLTAMILSRLRQSPTLWVTMGSLRPNVRREFKKWTNIDPHLSVERGQLFLPNVECIITSWHVLAANRDLYAQWLDDNNGTVVFDEVHMARQWKRMESKINPVTEKKEWFDLDNMSNAARKLAEAARYRVGLSATPLYAGRGDMWSQLDITEPDCWGTNWEFVHRYCAAFPAERGGLDTSGRSNDAEYKARLRETLHTVTRAEVDAHLPPFRRELVLIDSSLQSAPPADWRKRAGEMARTEGAIVAQIVEASLRKRKWLVEYLRECVREKKKVTVFTTLKYDLMSVASSVADDKTLSGVQTWIASGEDSAETRDKIAEAYMAHKGPCILLATGHSMGTGRNLQDTDVAIMLALPFTWGDLGQWEWRFRRPGQVRPCLIVYPICEGMYDERIARVMLSPRLESVMDTLDAEDAAGLLATLRNQAGDEDLLTALLTSDLGF